jgi:polar amino acid transport system substrate-binding protein
LSRGRPFFGFGDRTGAGNDGHSEKRQMIAFRSIILGSSLVLWSLFAETVGAWAQGAATMRPDRIILTLVALTISSACCFGQTPEATGPGAPQQELSIGTKETPPFAMKAPDGSWSGISIDLWRRVADELHLRYRFSDEQNVQALIDGVADGKYDMAVAALTVTAERERSLDFTEPFYATGLGIAVPTEGGVGWQTIIRATTSFGFAQAIAVLLVLALAVGLLVWFFERRYNDHFGGGATKGISSGVWWSATTMTQRGAGDFGPRTLPGRIVAIVWMIGSIVTVAVFTAALSSALTVRNLHGTVHGVGDLSAVRVGAVTGTSTEDTLLRLRIKYRKFASPLDGLKALRNDAIDALVYDRPLLAWLIQQRFSSSIDLVDSSFEPQEYAFALPSNSLLRHAINVALLDAIHSEWWEQTKFHYLGAR